MFNDIIYIYIYIRDRNRRKKTMRTKDKGGLWEVEIYFVSKRIIECHCI